MFPAHCTAAGKAILAYLSDDEIQEVVRNGLRQLHAIYDRSDGKPEGKICD
jgi:DNA-binding IclR family transcriptional regulator